MLLTMQETHTMAWEVFFKYSNRSSGWFWKR